MTEHPHPHDTSSLDLQAMWPILAGPLVIGVCLGMGEDASIMLRRGLGLPACVLGITLFTLPALYVLGAIAGVTPSTKTLFHAGLRSLRETGQLMLGLTPALLLLIMSTHALWVRDVFGTLCVAASMVLGIYAFLDHLSTDPIQPGRSVGFITMFALWSIVALGLGIPFFRMLMT